MFGMKFLKKVPHFHCLLKVIILRCKVGKEAMLTEHPRLPQKLGVIMYHVGLEHDTSSISNKKLDILVKMPKSNTWTPVPEWTLNPCWSNIRKK